MDKMLQIYRQLSVIPALVDAKLGKNGDLLTIWSQRNIEKSKATKFLKYFILGVDSTVTRELHSVDISNEFFSSLSPSEKYKAVFRETDDKQYLEIWQQHNLYRTVDLTTLDLHRKLYTDAEFRSISWSPDESKLLYIAEKKAPESKPYYQRKVKDNSTPETNIGQEYVFQQEWGEQMVGKKQSVIAQYDIKTDSVKILEGIPDDVCPGQVKYSLCGEYIVGVAFGASPRKLGLVFCSNRPAVIFKLKDGKYDILSSHDKACRTPFFSPDGKSIFYFEREAKGPHMAGVSLIRRDFPDSDSETVIVPIVEDEISIENAEKFFGLYNVNVNDRCWGSSNRLILSAIQKYGVASFVIDLDSAKITKLPSPEGNFIVLDIRDDTIVANQRNLLAPDVLVVAKLPPKGQEHTISWKEVNEKQVVAELEDCKYEFLDLVQEGEDSVKDFSAIYVGPSSGSNESVPLIVFPHGGPHSAFGNNFSLDISFKLSNGYAVLLVNYRGSIGAGDKNVHFLLGRIGTADVADCILATNTALKKFPWLDPSRLALCGGSHGGFLVTHLSGQYPDMFKAVVARNPVIDISSMSIFSDIPDWCHVECGKEYSQEGPTDDDLLLKMRKCSPIAHAHKVKAPTLLQIGSNDLRVPPGQSYDYYHRLKANGVKVVMHLYEDNHSLGQTKYELDDVINTILWLNEHVR